MKLKEIEHKLIDCIDDIALVLFLAVFFLTMIGQFIK